MICFTCCTLSYIPRARVLAETLRRVHPDWPLYVAIVDHPPPGFQLAAALSPFSGVIWARNLGISRLNAWLFKHDLVEACTAVKGAVLLQLFDEGADAVVYLDPDIAVFGGLAVVESALASASVVLTPHQTEPNGTPQAVADNEEATRRYGVYNLGFLCVRNDTAGQRFARWWADRLYEACYDDPDHGVFTDQRYADLVPALFDRVAILRDPGCNVASWNISRRTLAVTGEGVLTANGVPLAFYHFSKFGTEGDVMTDRYASGQTLPHELWHWYGRRLAAHAATVASLPARWWHYGHFADRTPVPRAARVAWRARQELWDRFPDPLAAVADAEFRAWLALSSAPPPASDGR